ARMLGLDAMQADQPRRLEHAGLHHQHQRGATRDGADRRLLWIEQRHLLFERLRLHHFEWNHRETPTLSCPAKAGHPVIAERPIPAQPCKPEPARVTGSSAFADDDSANKGFDITVSSPGGKDQALVTLST